MDAETIALGIAEQIARWAFDDEFQMDTEDVFVSKVATALRKYGEALMKDYRQTMVDDYNESLTQVRKEADAEGYRRGVEECIAELRNWKVWTPDHIDRLIKRLQRGQEEVRGE